MYRVFGSSGKSVYWCLDKPGFRGEGPILKTGCTESGITTWGLALYGLIRVSGLLNREDIKNYTLNHTDECVKMFDYSRFDREEYGYQSLNHQVVEIDSLDDCGSFGATLIELYRNTGKEIYLPLIEKIADYISNRQMRKEDGAFCRGDKPHGRMIFIWEPSSLQNTIPDPKGKLY